MTGIAIITSFETYMLNTYCTHICVLLGLFLSRLFWTYKLILCIFSILFLNKYTKKIMKVSRQVT